MKNTMRICALVFVIGGLGALPAAGCTAETRPGGAREEEVTDVAGADRAGAEPGHEGSPAPDCPDDAPAQWVVRDSAARLLCDIKEKKKLGGITVRIYGATDYQDDSCAHRPDAWKKEEIASVHCSYLHPKKCERRVKEKIAELVRAGYVVIVEDSGRDECPQPRL